MRNTRIHPIELTLAVALACAAPLSLALDISGSSTVQLVVERLIPLFTGQGGRRFNSRVAAAGPG